MGHLYHGYVSHNQRVYIYIPTILPLPALPLGPHVFHPFPVEELGSTWHTSFLWIRAEAELAIATGRWILNGGPLGEIYIYICSM